MSSKCLLIVPCLALALGACTPTAPARPTPPPIFTWIDAPLANTHLNLAPTTITFHGATPSGVEHFQVRVNDNLIDSPPPLTTGSGGSQYGTLFFAESPWTPAAAGVYLISGRAKANGGPYGDPAEVQITVDDSQSLAQVASPPVLGTAPSLAITPTIELPTSVPQITVPTATETPSEAAPGLPEPSFSDETFYYRGTSCGSNALTIQIMTEDPKVYSVVLFYRLKKMESGETTDWSNVAMNPLGGGMFSRKLTPETDIPGFALFPQSTLQVQLVATQQNGEEVARTIVLSGATLKACSAAAG